MSNHAAHAVNVAGAALSIILAFVPPAAAQSQAPAATPPLKPACDAPAAGQAASTSIVSFQIENDLFAGTDSQYTNGVKLTWVSPNLKDFHDARLPAWVRCSNDKVRDVIGWFLPQNADASNMVVTLGQAMYTPADRDRTTVDPADRPYAGWTYLGLGYNARFDPRKDAAGAITAAAVLNTLEIDVGIVGPHAYAKQTQDVVHRMRGFPRFQGWGNQLGDEFGLQVVWEQKLRPLALTTDRGPAPGTGFAAEAIPHYGVSFGNIATYMNVGAELRFGWRLPDDFGTSSIRPGGDNAAPRAADQLDRVYRQHSFHFFASFDGRAVANNIFLDGNTFRQSHAVKKRLLVGDIAYGWAYTWPAHAGLPSGKLAYAHYVQSREFEGEARNHGFGSVSVSVEY